MPSKLLNFPTEINDRIIQELMPFSSTPRGFPRDVRTCVEDLDRIFEHVEMLQISVFSSPALLQTFGHQVLRAVTLDTTPENRGLQQSLLRVLTQTTNVTRFLRLDGNAPANYFTLPKLLPHFLRITTLDLHNFKLSVENVSALQYLRDLETLSIQDLKVDRENIQDPRNIPHQYPFPRVRNLNIRLHGEQETAPLSCILKMFEDSVEMLSITSEDYSNSDKDLLEDIITNGACGMIKLVSLKHFYMDFLSSSAAALRAVVSHARSMETLSVDCRGIFGFLPLFYVFNLIRLALGERFDHNEMVQYDTGDDVDNYEDLIPQMYLEGLWKTRLSRFTYRIKKPEDEVFRRVLDTLELYFAREDEDLEPINDDIRLSGVSGVISSRPSTFRELKTLVLATENKEPLRSAETPDQLKDTARAIWRRVQRGPQVTVKWGDVEQFCCTSAGEIVDANAMDVEPLWSW